MSFIETIPPVEAEGGVLEMYTRQQGAFGYVPNYAKLFSHHPEIMARWGRLLAEIKRNLDLRRYELATFVAARALKSSYCSLEHGKALSRFYSVEDVQALASGETPDCLDATDRAIVRFAKKVAIDATSTTREDVESLKRHGLDDGEIFDIAATVAGRAFLTKITDALGGRPDSTYLEWDKTFVDVMHGGRSIATEAVEVLAPIAEEMS